MLSHSQMLAHSGIINLFFYVKIFAFLTNMTLTFLRDNVIITKDSCLHDAGTK